MSIYQVVISAPIEIITW